MADFPWRLKRNFSVYSGCWRILFQVIDPCLEVLRWQQYKTQNSFLFAFGRAACSTCDLTRRSCSFHRQAKANEGIIQ